MSIEDEARTLARIPMFRDLEPGQLRLIAFSASRLQVAPGDPLFLQGDHPDAVYVLLEGEARVEVDAGEGATEVARLGRDALLGEMGVLTGAPRTATVRAGGPLSVLRLEAEPFLALLDRTPSLGRAVMRDLALRLQETTLALVRARSGHP